MKTDKAKNISVDNQRTNYNPNNFIRERILLNLHRQLNYDKNEKNNYHLLFAYFSFFTFC